MTTPKRGLLYHFTHVSNLAAIAAHGIFCDSNIDESHRLTTDVGQQGIKAGRRLRQVPIVPGGVVADYVPFYFAARSPMLGSIHTGRVPTYSGGQEENRVPRDGHRPNRRIREQFRVHRPQREKRLCAVRE